MDANLKNAGAVADRFAAWWGPMVVRSLLDHGEASADFFELVARIGDSAQEVFGVDRERAGNITACVCVMAGDRVSIDARSALAGWPDTASFYADRIAEARAVADPDDRATLLGDLFERVAAVYEKREGLAPDAAQAQASRVVYGVS